MKLDRTATNARKLRIAFVQSLYRDQELTETDALGPLASPLDPNNSDTFVGNNILDTTR